MTHYERKVLGNIIKIRETAYVKLLKRFDPEYARKFEGRQRIHLPCPLCNHKPFEPACHEKCPFRVIGHVGCIKVIRKYTGNETIDLLRVGPDNVSWEHENDKKARHRLKRIREELRKFKRVET